MHDGNGSESTRSQRATHLHGAWNRPSRHRCSCWGQSIAGQSHPQREGIRASRLFEEVCLFVERFEGGISADAVRGNRELIEALQATWDGSASHAKALAAVIRSLAIFRPT